jgi:transcriptional regulator with XRE-family HTH domain
MTLTEWRSKEGLTMTQAAELLGLTQPTISRIEAGKQWPDKDTMTAIIERTGGAVTPNDFIGADA